MPRVIILENNGGRLANQLWQFASVYAYCLEKGYVCENYSFFRYARFFSFKINNAFVAWLFFKPVVWLSDYRLSKLLYPWYVLIKKKAGRNLLSDQKVFLLPPSVVISSGDRKKLDAIENSGKKTNWYFCGWLFRNPDGMTKHRAALQLLFRPKDMLWNSVCAYVDTLRRQYTHVIGVHIRRGDYKLWQNGQFLFTDEEVREVLLDFLKTKKYSSKDVCFMLCSDEVLDMTHFEGLSCVVGPGTEVEDLFALSRTDLIIGSHSTYGWWAAYYGAVPFVEFKRQAIDWEQDKEYTMEYKMTL